VGFSLKKMFSGSGWKKFKRGVGGVAGLAVGLVPGVGGVAGKLLSSKLGKAGAKGLRAYKRVDSTMQVLRASPVMPGGAVSTPGGMRPPMVTPPRAFRGSGGGGTRKRKAKPGGHRMKTRAGGRKRKLKFGSPAWRKKYMRKGRR